MKKLLLIAAIATFSAAFTSCSSDSMPDNKVISADAEDPDDPGVHPPITNPPGEGDPTGDDGFTPIKPPKPKP